MILVNQLSIDERDCERMRVQDVHNRVVLNNASADTEVRGKRTTQLKRGKSQTVAMNAATFETNRIVAIGETRGENQVLESKSHSIWRRWCKT